MPNELVRKQDRLQLHEYVFNLSLESQVRLAHTQIRSSELFCLNITNFYLVV